ncbi:MAG: DNA methyltransferase [Methanobacterium sp.]
MHQLSPYIGKIKSVIAHDLILKYSKPNDLIVDPFSGSGTIPLEAALLKRRVFACDASPYASVLTKAKLFPPDSLEAALMNAESVLNKIAKLPDPDLRKVPLWVRKFFHPDTLKETIKAVDICIKGHNTFLLSCILGILHHQRPGFLSYPSSHLVPYLRDKKYPRVKYPELYEYRPLRTRLISKIERAFRRNELNAHNGNVIYRQGKIENIKLPDIFDCLITSPPYMNALDYNRDNRLRLWFINRRCENSIDQQLMGSKRAFELSITKLVKKVEKSLIIKGYCIFIVGEYLNHSPGKHPSQVVQNIVSEHAPSLELLNIMTDGIPDVRRSRRNCRDIKTEHFLIFQRLKYAI